MANDINVKLSLNTAAFLKSLNKVERSLMRTAENMGRIGSQLSVSVSAPIALLGVSIVKTAANFEKSMNGVLAVTAGAGDSFKELEALARDLGATTQFSATEAANAIEMLGRNGLSATQILDGAANASLQLAAATGTDLSNAANIATDAMMQFGLEAKDLAGVADLIAGSTTNSKFSIDDFQYALANAGGVAGVAGVSFADFATSVAAISPAFASGQDAGTSLKTFFTSLVPSTKAATVAMERLGIITENGTNRFLKADGSLKSMTEIVDVLNQSFAGLSKSQQIQAAQTIFGTDAMRSALALAKSTGAEYEQLAQKIGDVSAADQAAIRMRGFEGAMKRLQSAFETLQLAIASSGLLDFATRFVEMLTNLALRASELSPALLSNAVAIGGVLAAMGPAAFVLSQYYNMQLLAIGGIKNMTMFLGRLGIVQRAATGAQIALNASMLANPVALLVAGIAALVAVMVVLYKRNEQVRKTLDEIGKVIAVIAKGALSVFVSLLQGLHQVLSAVFSVVVGVVRELFKLGAAIAKSLIQFVLGEAALQKFKAALMLVGKVVSTAFQNFPAVIAGVRAVIFTLAENVSNFFKRLGADIQILILRGRKAITLMPDAKKEIQTQIDALRTKRKDYESAGGDLGEAFRVGFRSQAFLDVGGGVVPDADATVAAPSGDVSGGLSANLGDAVVSAAAKGTAAIEAQKQAVIDLENATALQSKTMAASLQPLELYRQGVKRAAESKSEYMTRTMELSAALMDFNTQINNVLTQGVVSLGQAIGDLGGQFAAGAISVKQFASGIFTTLVNVLDQLGDLAIQVGVGVMGIRTALQSLNPVAAIAAGVALKAFASFAKSKLKDMATPFAEGGIVMPRPGGIFANIGEAGKAEAVIPLDRLPSLLNTDRTRGNMTLSTRVSGRDLLFVLREEQRDVGRFV